jgi:Ca2+-binding RTX toxin-like protein
VSWTEAIPSLVGTVIGGALTITGQRLTDRHRAGAERQAAARQAARDDVERDRKAVVALHHQVSVDVAKIRAAISATDEAVNTERADILAPLISDVRARSDRAAALIAVVPNEGVRHAADNVYDCFGQWLSKEVDSLTNKTAAPGVDEVLASPGKLATAVRDSLLELQVREKSAVEMAR